MLEFISSKINCDLITQRLIRVNHLSLDESLNYLVLYFKFLECKLKCDDYESLLLSPTWKIDIVWHHHILDTKRYEHDCIKLTGRIIHHNPDGDLKGRSKRLDNLKRVWKEVHNEDLVID